MRTFYQIAAFALLLTAKTLSAGEVWAPTEGYSSVNQEKTYNEFLFTTAEGQYTDDQTYEHETQVYNPLFADYAGTWSSNLPLAYYDTTFLDDSDIDNFTVGSAQASEINNSYWYYTRMSLVKGNSSDCTGCCSSHGGVCCTNGTTSCCDGSPLSQTCISKGCNKCANLATVRIKGQLGHRVPSVCYSTWCIFADATTSTMCLLNAPAWQEWFY